MPCCLAITNITPEANPTNTLAKLGKLHPLSNNSNPIIDTGILFIDPTNENVVGVVVDKNHNTEKEIPKETIPVKDAIIRNRGL